MVEQIVDIFEKLAALTPFLLAFGAGWTWLPKVRHVVNDVVIPVANAVITWLVVFATPVQAGIFDGIAGRAFSQVASIVVSVGWSALTSVIYDKFVKPVTPKTPYRVQQERKAAAEVLEIT